ncbi:MAG: hypothetical protein RL687_498 [Candidatus Parcubacteria bacterium]|jgi:hypothetical protein
MGASKNLLTKSVVCSTHERFISCFIELFMFRKHGQIKEVTYLDLVNYAVATDDTRCQRVALFRKAVEYLCRKLCDAGHKKEAAELRHLMY